MNKTNIKKKLGKKIIFGSSIGMVTMALIIIIPCLMILDFFGANITDDYVENNMDYADMYKETVNKALKNGYGYVPLNRILFFYLENEKLNFYDIYVDNIDQETNKMKLISEVCTMPKYRVYSGCKNLENNDQINEDVIKPFVPPVDVSKITITSFFMEERIVFGKSDVHGGWDLACGNKTPVKSTCDGEVISVYFPQKENVTDKNGGGGNQIKIKCEVDDNISYIVWYGHLYPGSSKVKEGDMVSAGQEVAGVGTTGYSTGPHLHYQVMFEDKKVDGMSLIDFSNEIPFKDPFKMKELIN